MKPRVRDHLVHALPRLAFTLAKLGAPGAATTILTFWNRWR